MAKTNLSKKLLMREIEGLSAERVKVLADLAAFLKQREEWEATLEIMANEELSEAIEASREAWKHCKREEFIPFNSEKGN